MSSDPPYIDDNACFTIIPLKTLSDQCEGYYTNVYLW